MNTKDPFPVEGTVTPTEYGFSADIPCTSAWIRESERGDVLQQAVDRAARRYGEGVEVEVIFYGSSLEGCTGFDLMGTVNEVPEQ